MLLLFSCGASPDSTPGGSAGAAGATGTGGKAGGGAAASAGASGSAASGGTAGKGGSAGLNAGGSSGASAGGAAGSGGSAPHTVGKCDDLGEIGVWENITPEGVPEVNSFAVAPSNPAIVYLATRGYGVFKTTDCGATFARIDDGASDVDGPTGTPGSWTMEADQTDADVVYMNNGYGISGVFKTTNGGVHWTQIITPDAKAALQYGGFVENIAIDRSDHLHVTVTPHFSCESPHSSSCLVET
ncbi:MAG TPA: hypothetical protein VGP93_15420, partial [Polyangiaceae bacterium]|nr:hypothetical protein [Polyangiaceae bacterium]